LCAPSTVFTSGPSAASRRIDAPYAARSVSGVAQRLTLLALNPPLPPHTDLHMNLCGKQDDRRSKPADLFDNILDLPAG
jgi:hypothetical protein